MAMDDKKELFSGDEFDKDDSLDNEQFQGDELKEDDSLDDDLFTGDELNEDGGLDDDPFTGDELNEDGGLEDDLFTGDELSEEDAAGDEMFRENKPDKYDSSQENTRNLDTRKTSMAGPTGEKKRISRKWLWYTVILVLIVSMVTSAVFTIHQKRALRQVNDRIFPSVTLPIPPKNEVVLEDFLIPLNPTHLYTCVAFSVVIRSWENELILNPINEKQWLRGRLYDILVKKIQNETDTPSLDTFRKWTMQAVHIALPDSHIISVEIHQFLVV